MSLSTWPAYGRDAYRWTMEQVSDPPGGIVYRRRLGVLEAKFDNAALMQGMADTFFKLTWTMTTDEGAERSLFARLPLAWARLRVIQPSLAATVHDAPHGANTTGVPGVPDREFVVSPPTDEREAYLRALETIIVEPGGAHVTQRSEDILHHTILNGPRVLLSQDDCLAKLIVVRDDESEGPSRRHVFFLVISHVISDGLSIAALLRALFDLLAQPDLPTPCTSPVFGNLASISHTTSSPSSNCEPPPADDLAAWGICPPPDLIASRLPLPLEALYPVVPASTGVSPTSVARRRWFWAVSRVKLKRRQRLHPSSLPLPRLPLDSPVPTISSEWPTLKLDVTSTARVVKLCRGEAISPSMLMYAVLSLTAANILEAQPSSADLPTSIVLGFPCSARPYITDPAPELSIRLTFGSIHLPYLPQPEVAGPPLRTTLLNSARMAKRQFGRRFALESRPYFFADTYMRTMDRLLSSAGVNTDALNEPKTVLNASMIGDLDRLLPNRFDIPVDSDQATPLVLSDLLIGTRLHAGEGMLLEVYTWDQRLTLSVGFDRNLVARELVDALQVLNSHLWPSHDLQETSMLTGTEVEQHASSDSLWMIVSGKVYDLTRFAPEHPGGMKILLKYAGKDATAEYEPIHPPGTIEGALSPEEHLGEVDMSTVKKIVVEEGAPPLRAGDAPVTLEACLNLHDIERAAEARLKPKAFAYYASAADDERTKNWNHDSFSRVRLRPRVLRDVRRANLSTSILGHKSSMPVFIAPAAMGKLAHPDGELCLARVAHAQGIPYMVSANSSISFEQLAALNRDSANPQTLIYQLYVNKDRAKTDAQLLKVVQAGFKAICVTVDAPVAGKRERDERSKMDTESATDPSMRDAVKTTIPTPDKPQGIAQNLGSYVDAALTWSDLSHIRKLTGLPLIVKGIQTASDAAMAVANGVEAIYLSNHGGRQLESAPASLETLLEIRRYEPHVFAKCEVYVDGGVRRGTDVLKALCLGATAVGVGRPFMYSLTFGDAGVSHVASILRSELAQNLRLLGATSLAELSPSMVNARELERNIIHEEWYEGVGLGEKAKGLLERVKAKAKL